TGGGSTGGPSLIQFVQDAQVSEGDCNFVTSLDSPQLANPITTGDVLVAAVTYGSYPSLGSAIQTTVFDDFGNTFTQVDDYYDVPLAQGLRDFYVVVGPAGPNDGFHVSFSPEANCVGLYVAEYAGADPVAPIAAHGNGEDADAGPGTDVLSLALAAPAAPALFWAFGYDSAVGQQPFGFVAGTGFTPRGPPEGVWAWGNGTFEGRPEEQQVADAGALLATWSVGTESTFILEGFVLGLPDAGP
ncbi:MAG TPA: hypothetical protein VMB50_12305, partial [Myxococcales bacterium]|nr:hypothetical protein [Myxococcales bacterium]